ncbi:DUF4194 domain-containing protein [Endozoicomonas sp. ONNA1]|uniref:DUF4194 domain-containing protein n=1 Tax=Endozoicomonas sp. ONNA1 TaxID=2828740 RepID=UPI0021475648|nr:DUF4194 domain-containing protein [Endozoicomonas sp. ONNA1]
MLHELSRLVDSNEQYGFTELDFQQAAAKLRANQFIWKEKRGHSRIYDILVKYETYFSKLFAAFGDDFFVDPHFGYCGIIPSAARPQLKQLETIYLLLLAKMHDLECRKACSENGRTKPSEAHLLDEYCAVTGREKPKPSETRSALDRLEKMGIIEQGEKNSETEMRSLTILPSIIRVVTGDFLASLELFCDKNSLQEEKKQNSEPGKDELEATPEAPEKEKIA